MALPGSWVEALHARLALRYGEAWARMYPDLDPAAVRADWADVLDRMPADRIKHALSSLPERPPNAIQFRALCMAMRVEEPPLLAGPKGEMSEEVAQRMREAAAKAQATGQTPAQRCYSNILRIVANERGGQWSAAQRDWVQQAHEKGLIDASALPWVKTREAA